MKKPTLIIMAAGLASRFGGGKQITPVDDQGQVILDYSLYDAHQAGFERVVFIIQPSMKTQFHEAVGKRLEGHMEVVYAFQTLETALPEGFSVPEGRTKPWGTAHAVLSAAPVIDGPFCVINADDFYGRTAFLAMYRFLTTEVSEKEMAMIGYQVENTLTENGTVARGVCETDGKYLLDINERTAISAWEDGGRYTEDGGKTYTVLPKGTLVSMNLWGFDASFMDHIRLHFAPWLQETLKNNPLKGEYYLPYIPHLMIERREARVRVLPTLERWYGITYREDLPKVKEAIAAMRDQNVYPKVLW